MAQSVELLVDPVAETVLRRQWAALAGAGLPTEQRSRPDDHHRPHITLYAADRIPPAAEQELRDVVADLRLQVQIGSVLVFGPRRDRCVLVRAVAATLDLLRIQQRVADVCGADPEGQFGAGRWSPHVTVARRVPLAAVGPALRVLGEQTVTASITACRRWDGETRTEWLLTG